MPIIFHPDNKPKRFTMSRIYRIKDNSVKKQMLSDVKQTIIAHAAKPDGDPYLAWGRMSE